MSINLFKPILLISLMNIVGFSAGNVTKSDLSEHFNSFPASPENTLKAMNYFAGCIPGTPFKIAGAVQSGESQKLDIRAQLSLAYSFVFNPDGTKLTFVGQSKEVFQYTLATAYDLSTATYDGDAKKLTLEAQTRNVSGISFGLAGTKMFIIDNPFGLVQEYTLTTAYDASTATFDGFGERLTLSPVDTQADDIVFNPDGSKLYFIGRTAKKVITMDLATAYDVSTGTRSTEEYDYTLQHALATSLRFSTDGTKMFLGEDGMLHQYSLSRPFDVSSASYDGEDSRYNLRRGNVTAIEFSADGNYMFVVAGSLGIWRYDLASSDQIAPTITSAAAPSFNTVQVDFSEIVKINNNTPANFSVVDGAGNVLPITGLFDIVLNNNQLELLVPTLQSAIGNIKVTYTNTDNAIVDGSCNAVATNATGVTIVRDTIVPTMSSATKDSETQITVTFSEPVKNAGANPASFKVVDGQGTSFIVTALVDGTAQDDKIALTVNDLSSGRGDLTITYDGVNNEISDFANNNLATDNVGVVIVLDITPPIVTSILRQSPSNSLTNAASVVYRVTFDEPVRNVTASGADFAVSGTSASSGQSVAAVSTSVYDVTLSGITGDGLLNLGFSSSQDITDFNNNAFAGTISANQAYTIDNTPPTVVSINRVNADPIVAGVTVVSFRIIFSENITGLDNSDLELALTSTATGTLGNISGIDPKTYDVEVNGISGPGTIGLNLKDDDTIIDSATNPLAATFTGQVYSTNSAPTDVRLSTANINENNPLSAVIGALSTIDADAGDSHTYALAAGAGDSDNSSFLIDGNNLKTNAISFDFETKSSYSVRLSTNDGKGGVFEKAIAITVNNVNESPISLDLSNDTVDENDNAQDVGNLTALDPDIAETFTFTLASGTGDTNNAEFLINGNRLSTAGKTDFEKGATRSIFISVSDAGGLTFDRQFTINIGEVEIEPLRNFETNKPGAEVKNIFSPNGDGVNETWVIQDIKDNPINEVKVYAQGGKLIYSKSNYQNDWDATFKGDPIPDGTYYYEINVYNGQKIVKGFLTVIRNK